MHIGGHRSGANLAVPVRGASGNVLAALNVSAQATHISNRKMTKEFLPVLQHRTQELSILLL
ncbi:IclR family transcriptional regulator C-terminal domain-containing protein [Collimonas sp.]|jgi:IclR family pca regulon transcriptional regulator|uniref:IclR family transcriptional regulator domain-containing protein n=1 Tax=Collimonas sp. TaxID=1963772 RepID=UPI0037C0816F